MKLLSRLAIIVLSIIFIDPSVILAQFNAGTYKASALGRVDKKHSGEVEVEVTVSDSKIEDIKIVKYEQSTDHKKYGAPVTEAKNSVPAKVLETQALGVDAVTKATMASNAIELAIAKALNQAYAVNYKPGSYKGEAYGRSDKKHNGHIEVEVTVSESKIEDIKILGYEQSVDHKKYGEPVTEAKTSIPAQILETQSLRVDAVSKATFASNAIELAVARALEKARVK